MLSSCRDFREIRFHVVNKTAQDITVEYRVRSCLGVNTSCFPTTYKADIEPEESVKLNIQDHTTTDYDIEESFFSFIIEQDDKASTFNFWGSDKLKKDIYDDYIEYTLTVDASFF